MSTGVRRIRVRVTGAVQGVGFRPFVYSLAARLGLAGHVLNDSNGVEIELEGKNGLVNRFLGELEASSPPLAIISSVSAEELEPAGGESFEIRASVRQDRRAVLVSPDYATCPDCLRELDDPADRRHRYPFTNCTNCGPRYTIITDIPYDRARTTMSVFEMCPDCRADYEDPSNRRFHAEPTCCAACGPKVYLADRTGSPVGCADPIGKCRELLAAGSVVAVKGLGGFHLACDASNDEAVAGLRSRKTREEKPLAVMVRDLDTAESIAMMTREEREALPGKERPILLLKKRDGHGLSELVAPKSATFGVMLSYTPLHHLLMKGPYPALVMTSGNMTDEPIAHRNDDALGRLSEIADFFLLNDRDIHIRTDDSVARFSAGAVRFLRRSRGYAPFPVALPEGLSRNVILAVGPELKNTVCVTRNGSAFVSHHVGDLKNAPAYASFLQAVDHLSNMLDVAPAAVAHDTHPAYLSTKYAKECGLPAVEVQHHHAHIASVLAERGIDERVIGVSFDGAGWGDDGHVWGGEFLTCDLASYRRHGHLEYQPLPGGDATSRKPYRMAYVYLRDAGPLPDLDEQERKTLDRMIERSFNTPLTSSAGRLFDAASAILNVCAVNTYEGQAPMELEAACAGDENGSYRARIDDGSPFIVRASDIIARLVEDMRTGTPVETCAARFHNSAAQVILEGCRTIRDREGISRTALSGGVFANGYLLEKTKALLEEDGFDVLLNTIVPAGDGGVSLGQAAIAARRLSCV